MAAELALDVQLSRTVLPGLAEPQMVYALLTIRPSAAAQPAAVPLDVVLIIDRSESMYMPILPAAQFRELAQRGAVREITVDGIPVWQFQNVPPGYTTSAPRAIGYVKSALQQALDGLGDADCVALVAFAGQAQLLVTGAADQDKASLRAARRRAIDGLDGLALGNDTRLAQGLALGLAEITRTPASQRVRRLVVLTDGFTLNREECLHLAQAAHAAGVAISTVGLGVEFDEDLLIALADMTGGNAYFATDPAEIPPALAKEMNAAQGIAWRDLDLKLRLAVGVDLRKAYAMQPAIRDLGPVPIVAQSANIGLGDLGRGIPQVLLIELVVAPRLPGTFRLAHLMLTYDGPAGLPVEADLVAGCGAPGEPGGGADGAVLAAVERVTAHRLQTRALQAAERGDLPDATAKLRAAATRLLHMGEDDLAQAALAEADGLERGQGPSPAGTKRLRYATRLLTGDR